MALKDWLWRLLKRKRSEPAEPLSPAEEMKAALGALQEQQHRRRRTGDKRRQHVEDYREVVLDGAEKVQLSEALLHLTHESHRNRRRLLEDESHTVEVPPEEGAGEARGDPQQTANLAANELKARMDEEGIPERAHYYSTSERAETGEVDRTYDTGSRSQKNAGPPDS
jgi:hypothetical protein